MKKNRWSSYTFNNGKIAKNRIIVPPMASQTADKFGFVTKKTIKHYQNLALSGAGLVFVEYSFVHVSGKGESNQLGADANNKLDGLSQIASVIQKSGALAGFQIVHAGGKTSSEITGGELLGPSAVIVPVKGWVPEVPAIMTEHQIKNYIQWFVDSAYLASRAGFDFVEIHAAHGYGLNQWLSPLTNKRTDQYGGEIAERSKILLLIIEKIKKEIPSLLIAVRVPAQDYIENGLTLSDMVWVTQKLDATGVDLIDVSSGIGGWKRPEGRNGQGYLIDDAQALKRNLSVPVIGVGGIENGSFVDEVVGGEKVDFTAVGRAILKNPTDWYKNNLLNYCNLECAV
jgi:NADPH2 dehydrogenase